MTEPEPNVLIGTLHVGDVPFEWFESYDAMRKPRLWGRISIPRAPTHHARNYIVNRIMGASSEGLLKEKEKQEEETEQKLQGVTHFFFMDDDMIFPEDALLRLLSHDVPIVSGFYVKRFAPFWPVPMRRASAEGYTSMAKFCKGLQEVDVVGGGCLLIKREVFEAIPYPWFEYVDPAHRGKMITEDVPFCEKVKAAGFTILLDFDVQCGHLFTLPVGYRHFQQHQKYLETESADEEQARIMAVARDVHPYRPAKKKSSKSRKRKATEDHAMDQREQPA